MDAEHPVALVDWDGTLASGVSALKFMRYLALQPRDPAAAAQGAPSPPCCEPMLLRHMAAALVPMRDRGEWTQTRAVELGSRTYCRALRGQSAARISELADSYVASHLSDLHFFTRDLLTTLADAGVTNVAVSGAPTVLLRAWARHLPLHRVHGLEPEQTRDGRYTGGIRHMAGTAAAKAEVTRVYANHPILLAAGDTVCDAPLFERAAFKITVGGGLGIPTGPRHLNIPRSTVGPGRSRFLGFVDRALGGRGPNGLG